MHDLSKNAPATTWFSRVFPVKGAVVTILVLRPNWRIGDLIGILNIHLVLVKMALAVAVGCAQNIARYREHSRLVSAISARVV